MSGTKIGGMKAAYTNRLIHGIDFYARIGAMGGRNGHTGGFNSDKKGADGLTGRERARIAGRIGGKKSRRVKKVCNTEYLHKYDDIAGLIKDE